MKNRVKNSAADFGGCELATNSRHDLRHALSHTDQVPTK